MQQQIHWGNKSWLVLLLLMAVASLLSRAMLSMTTTAFLLMCVTYVHWRSMPQRLKQEPAAWGLLLLFLIPAISGIWSINVTNWADLMLIKLPYLLMPLAFAVMPRYTERQWNGFAMLLLLILLLACGWSVLEYLIAPDVINLGYLRAKTLPVLMDNDHLRFSWLLAIGMMGAMRLRETAERSSHRGLALTAALLIFLFLHLLAARTGLVMAYLFWVGYFGVYRRPKLFSRNGLALLLIAAVVVIAWLSVPTLQNRWKYIRYTYDQGITAYVPGSGDGSRLLSLQAGWDILRHHPFGIGLGDVRNTVIAWYELHYPGMLETDKHFPANEWLIHGCAAGWPGVILFSIALFAPFFSPVFRKDFFATMLLLFTLLIAFTDSSLEGQSGIFIHTFTLLWWWQWLSAKKNKFVA